MTVISAMPRSMFHKCMHETLPNRWRKCIAARGAYFEGDDLTVPDDDQLLETPSCSSGSSSESE